MPGGEAGRCKDQRLLRRSGARTSAESISLCLADPEKANIKEIKEETPELQAA